MEDMTILSIDGKVLKTPTSYKLDFEDIDAETTTRSEDGYLHRDRIQHEMPKIAVGWDSLTNAEVEDIINTISPVSFQVQYYFGTLRSAQMYAGTPSLELVRINYGNAIWKLSFNLIDYGKKGGNKSSS